MPEAKLTPAPAAPTQAKTKACAEAARLPSLDKVTPEQFSRLNAKQQAELVGRLIEYLKTI